MELLETSVFTKRITALVRDEDYARFQLDLAASPEIGRLIPGGGGLRKVRIAIRGRGKRGGARVIYYWARPRNLIVLLYAYAKNETTDLTQKQVAELAALVKKEFGDEDGDV